jgi:hypothetical protein
LEVEEQRDLGAMISILTVAVQQLNENNVQLKKQNKHLENRLSEIEGILASIAKR